MRGLAPHWTFQTVEWSRKVASVHSELSCATHFVLPDLPGVISKELQREFYQCTHPTTRILTLVASQHTPSSLEKWIHERAEESDTFLIVGGNAKNSTSLSSVDAIQTARRAVSPQTDIWAVANPNDKTSLGNVVDKLEAGASGIITQPLLCSHAMKILGEYPRQDDDTLYLAGLALPKTAKGLYFWLNLLEQPELVDDVLFCEYVDYFSLPHCDSLAWSREQLTSLATDANVNGIHYMPVNNTEDLLVLLRDQ